MNTSSDKADDVGHRVALDAAFEARKAKSGAIARMVHYGEADAVRRDVRLRGGAGEPVVVSSVKPDGLASRNGVKPGDRLASVDGKKDLLMLAAPEILGRIHAPAVMVFIGFVGLPSAEVRIHTDEMKPKLFYRSSPFGAEERTMVVAEEKTFHPVGSSGSAPAPATMLRKGGSGDALGLVAAALAPSFKCHAPGDEAPWQYRAPGDERLPLHTERLIQAERALTCPEADSTLACDSNDDEPKAENVPSIPFRMHGLPPTALGTSPRWQSTPRDRQGTAWRLQYDSGTLPAGGPGFMRDVIARQPQGHHGDRPRSPSEGPKLSRHAPAHDNSLYHQV